MKKLNKRLGKVGEVSIIMDLPTSSKVGTVAEVLPIMGPKARFPHALNGGDFSPAAGGETV